MDAPAMEHSAACLSSQLLRDRYSSDCLWKSLSQACVSWQTSTTSRMSFEMRCCTVRRALQRFLYKSYKQNWLLKWGGYFDLFLCSFTAAEWLSLAAGAGRFLTELQTRRPTRRKCPWRGAVVLPGCRRSTAGISTRECFARRVMEMQVKYLGSWAACLVFEACNAQWLL